jgi:hypothetical protein
VTATGAPVGARTGTAAGGKQAVGMVLSGRWSLSRVAREALPLLVPALCSLVLFRDDLFRNVIVSERDTELFYLPLTRWFLGQLQSGHIPLWIPLIFGGYPLFADGEMGMLYPANIALGLLAGPDYFIQVSRALHLFVGSAFMYALLRVLGSGTYGGVAGGLIFGFGSFLVTQIQHENVIRSAVWLPLVLLCVELALRSTGWKRQQWLIAGGLAVAMAALGVHIQPVFMTLVCMGLYVLYRAVVGPVAGQRWERIVLVFWAPALVAGVGLGVALAQWLPLYELGRMSYRGPGLGYELATTWPLRWQNLPTVFLPYLFRLPDGRWVTLWQQWETFLYVGIVPLGLATAGTLLGRRRIAPFFVLLALFGLLVGLAEQSPLNIHRVLWSLPGFSSLRAPGRYAYLIVFAIAGLGGLGLDALLRHRGRPWLRWPPAIIFTLITAGILYVMVGLHRRLLADPVRWKELIDTHYLAVWHEHGWLEGQMVYDALVDGLSLSNPKTLLTVGLLVGTCALLTAWAIWPRAGHAFARVAVSAIAIDLLIFGYDFHPKVPYDQLVEPSPVAAYLGTLGSDARVFADSALKFLEPNTLLRNRVPTVAGYASLGPQRHFEYWASVDSQEDALLDIWGVRQVVAADPPRDVVIVQGTAYRPYNALFRGTASNRTGFAQFVVEPTLTHEVRVLSTLIDGVQIDQDTAMAEITLVGANGGRQSFQLLAGVHTAENAYDRADVQPHLRHVRPAVAGQIPDIDPNGLPTRTNIYGADFRLEPMEVVGVEIRQIYPVGHTRIFGLGLVAPSGQVRSLFGSDRAKFEPLWKQDGIAVLNNRRAFPRAYLVPEAMRRTRSDESALVRIASRPFDASVQVILEDGPFEGLQLSRPRFGQPLDPLAMPVGASVTDITSDRLRIDLPEGAAGYLVLTDLYHRGWRAQVDGRPTPVYLANFQFRAVRIPVGARTVEFSFEPLSLRIGMAASAAALVFVAVVGFGLPLWELRRRRFRTSA